MIKPKYYYKQVIRQEGSIKTKYYYKKQLGFRGRSLLKSKINFDIQDNINRLKIAPEVKRILLSTRKNIGLMSLNKVRQFERTTRNWTPKKAYAHLNYLKRTVSARYSVSRSNAYQELNKKVNMFNKVKYGWVPQRMREEGATEKQIRKFQRKFGFKNYLKKEYDDDSPKDGEVSSRGPDTTTKSFKDYIDGIINMYTDILKIF